MKFYCLSCYQRDKTVKVLFNALQPPYHDGFVYCKTCDDYDTHVNPDEELTKISKVRRELYRKEQYYLKMRQEVNNG